jgi:hypothetical protein
MSFPLKSLRYSALFAATVAIFTGCGGEEAPSTGSEETHLAYAARTSSAALTETSIRFATLGDFGWDGTPLSDVATLIKSWNPDLILALGDNNYDNGAASTIDANIGKYFHEYIYPYTGSYGAGATTNKFWAVLGNHEYSTSGAVPHLDYFAFPNNERYYQVTQGPVTFFAINSNSQEPNGLSSSSTQANWLMNALAANTSPWKIVFFHHPPFSSGSHGSNAVMQWPFQTWGAHAVITGHDHIYERIVQNGFPYFVNGLGGRSLYSFGTPVSGSQARYNANYGAQLVDATDQEITFRFYNRAGALIDTHTMSKSGGGGGGSTTISFQNNTTTNYATATTLIVDGDDPGGTGRDKRGLLQWDVSGIPSSKTVTAASITVTVSDASTQAYEVYQLMRTWSENGPTWNNYASGTAWQTAGADGANDRSTTVLGSITASSKGNYTITLNASGVALVQGWVNGSIANQGVMIVDAANSNGLDFRSSEYSTATSRPKLTVTYQ